MRYTEIKDIEGLDRTRRALTERLDAKGAEIVEDLNGLREACTPSNIISAGLRSASSALPFDRLALWAIRRLKSRL